MENVQDQPIVAHDRAANTQGAFGRLGKAFKSRRQLDRQTRRDAIRSMTDSVDRSIEIMASQNEHLSKSQSDMLMTLNQTRDLMKEMLDPQNRINKRQMRQFTELLQTERDLRRDVWDQLQEVNDGVREPSAADKVFMENMRRESITRQFREKIEDRAESGELSGKRLAALREFGGKISGTVRGGDLIDTLGGLALGPAYSALNDLVDVKALAKHGFDLARQALTPDDMEEPETAIQDVVKGAASEEDTESREERLHRRKLEAEREVLGRDRAVPVVVAPQDMVAGPENMAVPDVAAPREAASAGTLSQEDATPAVDEDRIAEPITEGVSEEHELTRKAIEESSKATVDAIQAASRAEMEQRENMAERDRIVADATARRSRRQRDTRGRFSRLREHMGRGTAARGSILGSLAGLAQRGLAGGGMGGIGRLFAAGAGGGALSAFAGGGMRLLGRGGRFLGRGAASGGRLAATGISRAAAALAPVAVPAAAITAGALAGGYAGKKMYDAGWADEGTVHGAVLGGVGRMVTRGAEERGNRAAAADVTQILEGDSDRVKANIRNVQKADLSGKRPALDTMYGRLIPLLAEGRTEAARELYRAQPDNIRQWITQISKDPKTPMDVREVMKPLLRPDKAPVQAVQGPAGEGPPEAENVAQGPPERPVAVVPGPSPADEDYEMTTADRTAPENQSAAVAQQQAAVVSRRPSNIFTSGSDRTKTPTMIDDMGLFLIGSGVI